LILEPTRELAAQVAENFETYGKYNKLSMALLIGGVSFGDQEKKLDRGVDVLIATPGRLLDHVGRGKVLLTGVQILVIDEADRMLDMGFIPDIEEICKKLPFTRQTLFFSATMPPEIQRLTDTFLQNPERIEVSRPATANATITQALVKTTRENKREVLRKLIDDGSIKNAIIFCNRKRDVAIVHKSLEKHGYSAGALHGDLDQSTRMKTLEGFRSGAIRLLVASDVAARGLDIPDVSHVFNFDVPTHAEDYVHRIGRTGRAGKLGIAFTIATREDSKYLAQIEKLIGSKIEPYGYGVPGDEPAVASQSSGPAIEQAADEKPRKRSRGGRNRKKTEETPVSDASASDQPETPAEILLTAGEENASVVVPYPAKQNAQPDFRKQDRKEHGRERQQNRGRGRDRDDDSPVIGLGDHVPAFILRAVKLPKRRPAGEDEEADIEAEPAA